MEPKDIQVGWSWTLRGVLKLGLVQNRKHPPLPLDLQTGDETSWSPWSLPPQGHSKPTLQLELSNCSGGEQWNHSGRRLNSCKVGAFFVRSHHGCQSSPLNSCIASLGTDPVPWAQWDDNCLPTVTGKSAHPQAHLGALHGYDQRPSSDVLRDLCSTKAGFRVC